jgi:molecular chaperone GrpE
MVSQTGRWTQFPQKAGRDGDPIAEIGMSNQTKNNGSPIGEEPPSGLQTEGVGSEAGPEAKASPVPEQIIAALQAEIADLKDRVLRAHAEVDNMRKRAEREKEETAKYAITRFARDIVGLTDNFRRAIGAIPAGAAEQDPALKSFLDGVTMIEREFLNVLERHAIKQISPQGEIFNPHLHQAVMETVNAEVPAGTVVQVFQPGYTIENRVLRPAMVVVAKGGQKPGKPINATAAPAGLGDDSNAAAGGNTADGSAGDAPSQPSQNDPDTN